MPTRPSLDERTNRAQTSIKMPAALKRQVEDYADQVGVPINSAMIMLLDRSLQAAGYPGISGRAPVDATFGAS